MHSIEQLQLLIPLKVSSLANLLCSRRGLCNKFSQNLTQVTLYLLSGNLLVVKGFKLWFLINSILSNFNKLWRVFKLKTNKE